MDAQKIIDEALHRFPLEAAEALNRCAAETVRLLCERHEVFDLEDVRQVMREARAMFEPLIERTAKALKADIAKDPATQAREAAADIEAGQEKAVSA